MPLQTLEALELLRRQRIDVVSDLLMLLIIREHECLDAFTSIEGRIFRRLLVRIHLRQYVEASWRYRLLVAILTEALVRRLELGCGLLLFTRKYALQVIFVLLW